MYDPDYLCDLHTHTVRSDGNDTYEELITTAAKRGMKVIAITDHDISPLERVTIGGQDISTTDYAKSWGIDILLGVEYSCDSLVDDVHIVAFGCDWADSHITRMNERIVQSKINGYKKLTEILTEHGIGVTWKDILSNSGKPRRPEDVQRKHIFEQIAINGHAKNWQQAKLMVKNNPVYNVKRDKPDPTDVIELIHRTGGIAILAHPYLIEDFPQFSGGKTTREKYIERLATAGLDGIEAAYTYSKTSYDGTLSEREIEEKVKKLYGHRLKIISGGSDYHNDGKKGVKNMRMLGEKGITPEAFFGNKLLSGLIKRESNSL